MIPFFSTQSVRLYFPAKVTEWKVGVEPLTEKSLGPFSSMKFILTPPRMGADLLYVCVCVCECDSQGKDLLPLHLTSSSIIYTVRNRSKPDDPMLPDTGGNMNGNRVM